MSSNKEKLDNTRLLNFLSVIDEDLKMKITLVAVGGTAMTLINAKSSTLDVDFSISKEDSSEFERVFKMNQPGFRVDTFQDSLIFNTLLPDDYLQKTGKIETNFENIELRNLQPLDIVVTKIGRLNDRDKEDIISCIKKFNLTKDEIRNRASEIEYIGGADAYDANLHMVLNTNFDEL